VKQIVSSTVGQYISFKKMLTITRPNGQPINPLLTTEVLAWPVVGETKESGPMLVETC